MSSMTQGTSPFEETTGKLTATYFALVSVDEEEQIAEAAKGLEPVLRKAVEDSYPGDAKCALVQRVSNVLPPEGLEYKGWTVLVTVLIDLTVWRRDLGLVDGRYAATTVRDLLADADMTASDARIDSVETRMLAHAPA